MFSFLSLFCAVVLGRSSGIYFRSSTQNVSAFRSISPTNIPQSSMLTYSIIANHKNAQFLPRLICALTPRFTQRSKHSLFFVQIDASLEESEYHDTTASLHSLPCPAEVYILPQEAVHSQGISLLLAHLQNMETALNVDESWTHIVPLRANDYPLVSPEVLESIAPPFWSVLDMDEPEKWDDFKYRRKRLFFDPASAVFPHWEGLSEQNISLSEKQASSGPLIHTNYARIPIESSTQYNTRSLAHCDRVSILNRDLIRCALYSTKARQLWVALATVAMPEEHFFCMMARFHTFYCSEMLHSSRNDENNRAQESFAVVVAHGLLGSRKIDQDLKANKKETVLEDVELKIDSITEIENPSAFVTNLHQDSRKVLANVDALFNGNGASSDAEQRAVVEQNTKFYDAMKVSNVYYDSSANETAILAKLQTWRLLWSSVK